MKLYVKARVSAVECEAVIPPRNNKVGPLDIATLILDCGDGDFIAATVYGKDRIAVCKEKMKAELPMDLILSIVGKVEAGRERTFYKNQITVKWILS